MLFGPLLIFCLIDLIFYFPLLTTKGGGDHKNRSAGGGRDRVGNAALLVKIKIIASHYPVSPPGHGPDKPATRTLKRKGVTT